MYICMYTYMYVYIYVYIYTGNKNPNSPHRSMVLRHSHLHALTLARAAAASRGQGRRGTKEIGRSNLNGGWKIPITIRFIGDISIGNQRWECMAHIPEEWLIYPMKKRYKNYYPILGHTLWFHQTWLAGKSPNSMEVSS